VRRVVRPGPARRLYALPVRRLTLLVAVILVLGAARKSSAQARLSRVFDASSGLPSSGVWGIAQDSDGFLWISTDDALVRYDGYEMRVIAQGRNHLVPGSGGRHPISRIASEPRPAEHASCRAYRRDHCRERGSQGLADHRDRSRVPDPGRLAIAGRQRQRQPGLSHSADRNRDKRMKARSDWRAFVFAPCFRRLKCLEGGPR